MKKVLCLIITVTFLALSTVLVACDSKNADKMKDKDRSDEKYTSNHESPALSIYVTDDAFSELITVSEKDDNKTTNILTVDYDNEITNITYDWLPQDINEYEGGAHHGENHLAYTFYLNNFNDASVIINEKFFISNVTKNTDEAVRVMVYRDDERTIYAKKNADGSELEDIVDDEFIEVNKNDEENLVIIDNKSINIEAEQSIKYTIVVWIEGVDPDCTSDIMGGAIELQMEFSKDS